MTGLKLGDTVAFIDLLPLGRSSERREGMVTALWDDGRITVSVEQSGGFPMRVTSDAEDFTLVREFVPPDDVPLGQYTRAVVELQRARAEVLKLRAELVSARTELDLLRERET